MKHYTTRFSVSQLALLILLWNLSLIESVYGQLDVEFTPKNCDVEIKSTFDFDEIIDPLLEVTSVGVFYRLDKIVANPNGEPASGSYFWSEIIPKNKPEAITELPIPPGYYRLTYYITRKGGPIKTGIVREPGNNGSTILNLSYNNCSSPPASMPIYKTIRKINPESTIFYLVPSWSPFGFDPKYYGEAVEHNTEKTYVQQPDTPWIFITLVASDWKQNDQPIQINFDNTALEYAGAIGDNIFSMDGGSQGQGWKYVNRVLDGKNGTLTVTPKLRPDNGVTVLHLIFKKTGDALDTLTETEFKASMGINPNVIETSTKLEVSGAPHDPNNLKVDKDTLCPCQIDEWLTYNVKFQNLGSAPAKTVTVSFLNYQGLILPTLYMPVNRTFRINKSIRYDSLDAMFVIDSIMLPGMKQPNIDPWQTIDGFSFKIKKQDCLAAGTLIQPKVGIVFIGDQVQDTIYTNLEATHILDKVKRHCFCEKSYCPAPHASCPGCKKKKIWWRDCLCRILHWHWHKHS